MAAKILMGAALFLAAGSFLVKNPTAVGMVGLLSQEAELARGVTRITRHPFQWGVMIWSGTHKIVAGSREFQGARGTMSSEGVLDLNTGKLTYEFKATVCGPAVRGVDTK